MKGSEVHKPRIALLGGEDPLLRQLARHIQQWGGEVVFLDPDLGGGGMVLTADQVWWSGVDVGGCDAVWVQGFTYENPVIPPPVGRRDHGVWQYDHLCRQQSYSATFSMLQELDRRGVTLYNPPRIHLETFARFNFLEGLRQKGFGVPDLLSVNDPDAAYRFMVGHDRVLWHPATGRAGWQLFEEKQRKAFVDPGLPSILLAGISAGPCWKTWLLNGHPLLTLEVSPPAYTPPVERLELLREVAIQGTEVEKLLRRLHGEAGLMWAMVTHSNHEGEAVVIDVDVDPVMDWLPSGYQTILLEAIAHTLVQGFPPDHSNLSPPQPRSALFLRRMMGILFQFEQSKRQ